MTDGNDVFDRNLERMLRSAAPPPAEAERARRDFLARLEGPSPAGRRIAMAAALLFAAALLYSALAPSRTPPPAPPVPQDPAGAVAAPGRKDPAPDPLPPGDLRAEPRPPLAARTVTARDDQVSVTATFPPPRTVNPLLTLVGAAPYPDGTTLQVSVQKTAEQLVAGRLAAVSEELSMKLPVVEQGRFSESFGWSGEGRYLVTISLLESQRADVAAALKRIPARTHKVDLAAWDDGLVAQLPPVFLTLEDLSKRAIDLVGRMETLAARESTWIQSRRNVDDRGSDVVLTKEAQAILKEMFVLVERLDKSDAQRFHPAAVHEMRLTIQKLSGSAAYFAYEKATGKFAGVKNYHFPEKGVETHRGEPFTFDVLKRYLAEVAPLAGRETALWMVRDLRRTEARPTPGLSAALKVCEARPGVAAVAARLAKATAADLEGIEKDLRAGP